MQEINFDAVLSKISLSKIELTIDESEDTEAFVTFNEKAKTEIKQESLAKVQIRYANLVECNVKEEGLATCRITLDVDESKHRPDGQDRTNPLNIRNIQINPEFPPGYKVEWMTKRTSDPGYQWIGTIVQSNSYEAHVIRRGVEERIPLDELCLLPFSEEALPKIPAKNLLRIAQKGKELFRKHQRENEANQLGLF